MTLWDDDDIPVVKVAWQREMWVADPGPFTPICFDYGVTNFAFRGKWLDMNNMRQDFRKFMDTYARGRPWRLIYVPYPDRQAILFTSELEFDAPAAVWPIWRCDTDKWTELEELWERPQNPDTLVSRWGGDIWEALEGQEHRVIVAGFPGSEHQWADIATKLMQLQATDPAKTIHSHGQKSVGRTIGIGIKSFDHHVRLGWDDGFPRILLPNGMTWRTGKEPSRTMEHWLGVVGTSSKEVKRAMKGQRKPLSELVYAINLRSLRWAFFNWDRAWDFRRAALDANDLEAAEADFDPKTLPLRLHRAKGEQGLLDKWLCDTCSLQFRCPLSREGAVCAVPDTEPEELAQQFGTRNSASIMLGLSNILAAQSRRANRALKAEMDKAEGEDEKGNPREFELDPALTRLLNTLFDRGVQMAKLVDPRIAAQLGTKVNVNLLSMNGTGSGGVGQDLTPQALMGGIAAELEARGIDLADATPELIQQILSEAAGSPAAIEASSREQGEME